MSLQDIAPNMEKQETSNNDSIYTCVPSHWDVPVESFCSSSIAKEDIDSIIKTKELLEEENKILKKALLFYTNERNFDFEHRKELRFCNSDDQADVYQSFGTKAKEALNFYK